MGTAHIQAKEGEIAKIVLMPGDPLRAKFIADTYLENVTCFNKVRNMFGFTGYYKGMRISVMGSGMGIPSLGIYSYELFSFYGVETIIRIGSAGSYTEDLNLFDVILVKDAYSESSYMKSFNGDTGNISTPSLELNNIILETSKEVEVPISLCRIHSSDVFYHLPNSQYRKEVDRLGCLAVEMESYGLFAIAKALNKKAACILTISDSLVSHKETTHEERQFSFKLMIKLALESALKMDN